MTPLREKIAYALGDAASGGITWKIMSIAFPMFFKYSAFFSLSILSIKKTVLSFSRLWTV